MDIQTLIKDIDGVSNIKKMSDHLHRFSINYKTNEQSQFFIEDILKFPNTYQDFLSHQSHNLEEPFFSAKESVQWNIYYYLLLEDTKYDLLKNTELFQQIENDKKFARKKIIPKSKIGKVYPFLRLLKKSSKNEEAPDLVELWRTKLPSDFDILFSDSKKMGYEDICLTFCEKIENLEEFSNISVRQFNIEKHDHEIKHLGKLSLNQYREYPTEKNFTFGKVNLIDGSNGVGKTSLLEAIELVLCGSSYRSGDKSDKYKISLDVASPQKNLSYPLSPKSIYGERQLSWYSVATKQNVNRLSEQFSRYNFFNTDAAFDLAKSKDKVDLNTAINSIIVGPEASQIESRIQRLEEEFRSHDNYLSKDLKTVLAEIEILDKSLQEKKKSLKSFSYDPDLIRADGRIIGINIPSEFDDTKLTLLENHGRQLVSKIEDMRKYASHLTVFSRENVKEYLLTIENLIADLRTHAKDQETIATEIKQKNDSRKEILLTLDGLRRYKVYASHPMAKNLSTITDRMKYLESKVKADEKVYINYRLDSLVNDMTYLNTYSESTEELRDKLLTDKNKFQQDLDIINKEIQKRQSEKQSLESKVSQLKQLAHNVINLHKLHNCPVCDQTYDHLDLLKRTLEQTSVPENDFTKELEKKNDLEKELRRATDFLSDCEKLLVTGNLINGDKNKNLPPKDILSSITKFNEDLQANRKELLTIELNIRSIQDNGFSLEELVELKSKTYIKDISSDSALAIQESIDSYNDTLNLLSTKITELEDKAPALANLLKESQQRMKDLFPDLSSTADVKLVTNKLQDGLREIGNLIINLDDSADLIQIESAAGRVVTYLESSIKSNKEIMLNSSSIQDVEKQLAQKKSDLATKDRQHKRCAEALTIFTDIRNNHSVQSFAQGFLKENIELIKAIFSSVHHPNEFDDINLNDGVKLIKDGQERTLDEISTGQRSAFALSVFVGMHLTSSRAPKFLMFDDPISFVDDLNVLSFLDLLRELVISMDRQIFFATANDKLAALFKRKFSFLGDEFKPLSFQR